MAVPDFQKYKTNTIVISVFKKQIKKRYVVFKRQKKKKIQS